MISKIPKVEYPPPATPFLTLSKENVESCLKAASALNSAFTWANTAEGSDFWYGVQERLEQIARDGQLK